MSKIPCFRDLKTLVGLYRLPSGRIAEVCGCHLGDAEIVLQYLDNGERIQVRKSWLASCAVVV